MGLEHNKALKPYAQALRREMTDEERILWYQFLSRLSVRVLRQKMIGHYIVDFYCHRAKLAIELDGSQHFEDSEKAYDHARDQYLERLGLRVLRYSNSDVNRQFENVCNHILLIMEERTGQEIFFIK